MLGIFIHSFLRCRFLCNQKGIKSNACFYDYVNSLADEHQSRYNGLGSDNQMGPSTLARASLSTPRRQAFTFPGLTVRRWAESRQLLKQFMASAPRCSDEHRSREINHYIALDLGTKAAGHISKGISISASLTAATRWARTAWMLMLSKIQILRV